MVIGSRRLRIVSDFFSLGLIEVNGPDAEKFLQNLATCDITKINTSKPQLGAFCNLKGRIISSFHITQQGTIYYLLLPLNMIDITLNHLKKYSVFSKVQLQDVSKTHQENTDYDWHLANIKAGVATIYPQTTELFTPHMLNYPQLGAVSFDKGCYLGQEIIARTQYLGKTKRELKQINITAENSPNPGDKFFDENNVESGIIVDAAQISPDQVEILVVALME